MKELTGPVACMVAALAGCDSSTLFPQRDAGQDLAVEGGMIEIMTTTNSCPTVAITVSPPDGDVGSSILVGAGASDPDVGADGGQTLAYAWSATSGTFDNKTAVQTTFRCTSGGPQVLTVTVSDGRCAAAATAMVTCFGMVVGSGGTSGGSGATSGSSGGTMGGTGATMGGSGGMGGKPASGSGTGGQKGGQVMAECPGDPTTDEGKACNQCTKDNCNLAGSGPNPTDGCSLQMLGSDTKVQLCQNLFCCLRANHCMAGEAGKCWCGTAAMTDCQTKMGVANGPCLHDFEAAAESVDPMVIKGRFIDPSYAIGGAVNLFSCRAQFCSTADPSGTPSPEDAMACKL